MGEIMNGYELRAPFQNKDAGFSRWTFADKNGKVYFMKEFMDPVYPDQQSLSESLRQKKIAVCKEYEQEKLRLYHAVNRVADGNLVKVTEFFRCDSHYYVVMPKVEPKKITMQEISRLSFFDRVLLCRTAARGIMLLHQENIVHSDIKDSNVLVDRMPSGKYVARIIDYDCSFFEDCPPTDEDDLGGDQVYLAPEACQFIFGEDVRLTCKMDVFSLGLLFHQYLTGTMPGFDTQEYDYPHEAVLDDQVLRVSSELRPTLRVLLERMLDVDPMKRPDMSEVFGVLGNFIPGAETVAPKTSPKPSAKPKPAAFSSNGAPEGFFSAGGDL